MVCIYCDSDTKVYNSRHQKRENNVWRRRMCTECEATFTTTESVDLSKSIAFKDLQGMEPFLRDKLFLSVNDSLRHRKTHLEDSAALTDTIIAQCLDASDTAGQIERTLLVKTTLTVLERFDDAGATSYRAFHKDAL